MNLKLNCSLAGLVREKRPGFQDSALTIQTPTGPDAPSAIACGLAKGMGPLWHGWNNTR